uniref:Uncharacterized protein n=1 Tax=Schistocephalus solidus TaxID=70667 RepID=A0A0X3Q4V7_SCHSO
MEKVTTNPNGITPHTVYFSDKFNILTVLRLCDDGLRTLHRKYNKIKFANCLRWTDGWGAEVGAGALPFSSRLAPQLAHSPPPPRPGVMTRSRRPPAVACAA